MKPERVNKWPIYDDDLDSVCYFLCSKEIKDGLKKIFIVLTIKFHENSSAGNNAIPYPQTDGWRADGHDNN